MSDTAVFRWEPIRLPGEERGGRPSRLGTARFLPNPLETIRIPVTPRNRERLRRLRTRELEAWRPGSACDAAEETAWRPEDRAAQILLILLALTVLVVLVRTGGPNLFAYLWDTFRDSLEILMH